MDVFPLRGLQVSPERDFDRKAAIRAEKHEQLRRRTNVTSCRIPARDHDTALLKDTLKNKRQVEFMRRRSLPSQTGSSSSAACSSSSSRWSTSEWMGSRESSLGDTDDRIMRKMMEKEEACMEAIKIEKSAHESDKGNNGGWPKAAHLPQQKTREASVQTQSGLVTIEESGILQLQDYMQEGLWREEAIKKKMTALQGCCTQLQNALNTIWNARCSEDVLRNKIKFLETQLQACLQRFPKEASRKLALQMKKQRMTFEEKTQRVTDEKNEEFMSFKNPDIQSQEALMTAKADVRRLQSLYEEMTLTSQKLRQELDVSGQRAREQEAQIELSRAREATLTEEVASLRRENNQLLFNKSLQDEYYQLVMDQDQSSSNRSVEKRDASVQSTPEEEEAKPKADCDVEEHLHHAREELRCKEKECQALQTELHTMKREFESSQARLSQCREELGRLGRGKATRWILLLLWAVIGVAILQPWHPIFREKLEDFYSDVERRLENFFVQMAFPKNSGCCKPV